MDLFALTLPLTFDGLTVTPWVMPGMMGRNTGKFAAYSNYGLNDGSPATTLYPYLNKLGGGHGLNVTGVSNASKEYGTVFWAGLPIKVTALEPWNIDSDTNYGYVEQMGSFNVMRRNNPNDVVHGSTKREGWFGQGPCGIQALTGACPASLAGTPLATTATSKTALNVRFLSVPTATSPPLWATAISAGAPTSTSWTSPFYAGTWGIGAQIRDVSFIES